MQQTSGAQMEAFWFEPMVFDQFCDRNNLKTVRI